MADGKARYDFAGRVAVVKSPAQCLGEPAEVAELVAWPCSGSCSFNAGAVFD